MFHEDHLPPILNFHDQPISVTFEVENGVRSDKIGVWIRLPNLRQASPTRVSCYLVPIADWTFQGVIGGYSVPPAFLMITCTLRKFPEPYATLPP